jgi:hypothetical protein
VSWQSSAGSNLPRLLAHELTHLATREMVGQDAVLPAWFERGLAAQIEAGNAGIDHGRAAGGALAHRQRSATLDTIATLADWHREYAKLGTALYAVSAELVNAVDAQIGRGEMFAFLSEIGHGARFEDAFRAYAGEDLDVFLARFTGEAEFQPTVAVGNVPDSKGNFRWTLTGFARTQKCASRSRERATTSATRSARTGSGCTAVPSDRRPLPAPTP